jgi:tRNA-binding protein
MPYATFTRRRISSLEPATINGSTFKRYAVDSTDIHDDARFAAAVSLAASEIPPPDIAAGRPGAGFIIEHQGRTGDYFVVCWWDNENELPIRVWVRGEQGWRSAGPAESVCVWDLEIIGFERRAWIDTVLSGAEVEDGKAAYLSRRFEEAPAVTQLPPVSQKPTVAMDVIEQVDLRVGTITSVTPVDGSDKLMRLVVDFGADTRTVIAGIRQERSQPDLLVGRQALFYYNLEPRKMRGERSEAMLCDVGYADSILPALLQPEWPVPNGTRAG